MDDNSKTGTFVGTGAVKNIPLGFSPDYVRCVNVTDGDRIDEWFSAMGAGTSIQTINHDTVQHALNAADGITAYAGSATEAPGFTVGTDVSENGKTYCYLAIRNRL